MSLKHKVLRSIYAYTTCPHWRHSRLLVALCRQATNVDFDASMVEPLARVFTHYHIVWYAKRVMRPSSVAVSMKLQNLTSAVTNISCLLCQLNESSLCCSFKAASLFWG